MKKIIEIELPSDSRAMVLDIEYMTTPNGGWSLGYWTIVNPTAIDYALVPIERFVLRPIAPVLWWIWCEAWDLGEWIVKKMKEA